MQVPVPGASPSPPWGPPLETPKPLFYLGRDVEGCSMASPEGPVLCSPKSLAPGEQPGEGFTLMAPWLSALQTFLGCLPGVKLHEIFDRWAKT